MTLATALLSAWRRIIRLIVIILFLCPAAALAWPSTPPRIGNLVLSQEYWGYVVAAALEYQVDPCIIQGVMAIESRYDPWASSGRGRCQGLMQLDRGVARGLGIDPWIPRENIRGGACILARLLRQYHGDLRRAVRKYNGTGNRAYEREVIRAVRQAGGALEKGDKS